jgi:hypothetical protein
MTRRLNGRRAAHADFIWRMLMASLAFWLGSAAAATWFSPRWPHGRDGWLGFGLAVLICEFLGVKIFQMAWPTTRWTRLGASLIAVNAGFLILYLYVIFATLWPVDGQSKWGAWLLRGELLAVLIWSVVELLRIQGEGAEPRHGLTAVLTASAACAALVLAWRTGWLAW